MNLVVKSPNICAAAEQKKSKNTNDPESGISDDSNRNQDNAIATEAFSSLCLVLMATFFICGTYFLQRGTRTNLKYPFAFFVAGSVLYIVHGCLEVYKKFHDKVERVIPIITVIAGELWFIASIFLLRNLFFLSVFTKSFVIWSSLWLAGSALNIISITFNFALLIRRNKLTTRSVFLVASLVLSWLANILFLIGCAIFIKIHHQGGTLVEYDSFCKLLIAASVMLLLHSVCYTWHHLNVDKHQH